MGIVLALETRQVSYRRAGGQQLLTTSLCVERGEVLALYGADGSGAETLLRLFSGEAHPDCGRVLVDGAPRGHLRPVASSRWHRDPRILAHGPGEAFGALGRAGDDAILLLDDPLHGLDRDAACAMLRACVHRAHRGAAVVLTVATPEPAAAHVHTLALFVAGRLIAWGSPTVALAPTLRLLGSAEGPLGDAIPSHLDG